MKFRSIAQFNMFKAVSQGIRKVAGLTRKQATNDIKGKTPKGLVARVSKKVRLKK